MSQPVTIDEALAAFLRHRTSLVLSAASGSGLPELCTGLACLVDDDGRGLSAVVDRRAAEPLLELVAGGCRRVAMVCCRPSTLRTVQVKGDGAFLEPLPAQRRAEVLDAVSGMHAEFDGIGFGGAYAAALLDHDPGGLVCVRFVPVAVFEQTPGPRAGRVLAPSP